MPVLAPMPSARVIMATVVSPAFFANIRRPKRTSCHPVCMTLSGSLVAQRHDGIYARRATGRDTAGHKRNGQKENRNREETQRIDGSNLIKQAADETNQCERGCQTSTNPAQRPDQLLSQDQLHDVAPTRAQRYANTD